MMDLLKASVASSNNSRKHTHGVGRTLDQKSLKSQNSKKSSKPKNNTKCKSNNHAQKNPLGTLPCATSSSIPYSESYTAPQQDAAYLPYVHTQSHTPAHTSYTQGEPPAKVQDVRTVQRNITFSLNALATIFVPNGVCEEKNKKIKN